MGSESRQKDRTTTSLVMESYYIVSLCLLAVMATGAQAACNQQDIMGCVNSLMGSIQNMGTSPTEDDIKSLCSAMDSVTSCLEDKVVDCPADVQKQFNDQLATQKAAFQDACKNYSNGGSGSTGGASS